MTGSLEFQDATLLESLCDYIYYNTTMKSCQESHGITSNSYHIHVSHTKSTCYLKTSKSHANAQPTNQPIHDLFHTKHNKNLSPIISHKTYMALYFML